MSALVEMPVDRDAIIAAENPCSETVERLLENARRLRKPAQVTAMALALVTSQPWAPLCVWCLEREDPGRAFVVHRQAGGECACCPYVGRDVLIIRRALGVERAA